MTAAEALLTLPQGGPPELTKAINDGVRDILDRHGLAAFQMPREAAIAHEVGHAIVGAHEGYAIRSISIFSRSISGFEAWGGYCTEAAATWTTGPDTTAADDLRRARFIIAGLAGEAVTRTDKPGSSLDELALSQMLGVNAAVKLNDDPSRSDEDYRAFVQRLWHTQVWDVTLAILCANWEPFNQIMHHLRHQQRLQGAKLRRALAQVRRIAS